MSLHLTLKYLFPDINFRSDCFLQDDGDGAYIASWRRPEPQPDATTLAKAEIEALAAAAATKAANDAVDAEQRAGIAEAKRAYARMQTIIDGADTATTAQMRLAIKEIAHDIQHLIRAAVR